MTSETALSPARSFQGLILTLQQFWAGEGCVILQPYDMEMGAGTFHPATTLRGARAAAVARRLCPALAAAEGRALRREPEPAPALLPVPGHPEAEPAGFAGPLPRVAEGHWSGHAVARRPVRRGRLGEADARRLGSRLGMLVRRHGGVAVHLLPAGRRPGMRAGLRRARRTASSASRCTSRRSRQRLRLNFNGGGSNDKVTYGDIFLQAEQEYSRPISSTPTPRCCSASSRTPKRPAERCLNVGEPKPGSNEKRHLMAQPRLRPGRSRRATSSTSSTPAA